MRKYFVIQCYTDTNRRRIMYQVQDSITGEILDFTDEEWNNAQYTEQDSEKTAEFYKERERTAFTIRISQKRKKK